jgi:hypothetical protein
MKKTKGKNAGHVPNPVRDCLDHLAVCVYAVRRHRQMNASETPETQSTWERLDRAVLEAEWVLAQTKQIPLDKPARKKHTVSHLPIRMAHGSSARNAGR